MAADKRGPSVVIMDANTATPTIAGSMVPSSGRDPTPTPGSFPQTDEIQECELQLVVGDGELTSEPDTVKIVIVPDFGENLLELRNDSFDAEKPTIVYFGGGDCTNGTVQYSACPLTSPAWFEQANIIYVPKGYDPDSSENPRTYYKYGDMLLVYLCAVAPDYEQLIQTSGWSTGGQPAIDAGIHVNLTYKDRRYGINRVTFFDATPFCRDYSESIAAFLGSSVDGEQCWVDNYISTPGYGYYSYFYDNVLNIWFDTATDNSIGAMTRHKHAQEWYNNSLTKDNMTDFNSGVVAGSYWSVVGPGKNLQLASTSDTQKYKFIWYGWNPSGHMDFYNETYHPGRLPEPVTLIGPDDRSVVDANGAVFSCEESENAVGYQLLFGSDPYRVMDYFVVSDTPIPPVGTVSEFPFEETWWTIRAYDTFGSTIHADPRCVKAMVVSPPMPSPRVAYVYHDEVEVAEGYQALLTAHGCPTTLVPWHEVATTAFDAYDLIIAGADTGYLTTWANEQNIAAVEDSGKPVVGLGNGGYYYFGYLGLTIGKPSGGYDFGGAIEPVDPNHPLFGEPYPIEIPQDGVLELYADADDQTQINIYLWPAAPDTVTTLGVDAGNPGYYSIALENDRYLYWGFTGSAESLTEAGRKLLVNAVIRTANTAWASEVN